MFLSIFIYLRVVENYFQFCRKHIERITTTKKWREKEK
jgi:hypothetical protein